MKALVFTFLGIFTLAAIGAVDRTHRLSAPDETSLRSVPPPLPPLPAPSVTPHPKLTEKEREIEERDLAQDGITVDEPEVFDDAMLQQMLQDAESRLASLQAFDQASLKFGAVSGATQQISGFGLSVQGPSLPGVTTADKGATGGTSEIDKINSAGQTTETTLTTTAGQPAQDVTTTRAQVNPQQVTAPAPSTTLPTTPSVAASRILNEQAQLSAQIQMLRMLLRGSLSSQFTRPQPNGGGQLSKLKTTLGFPITISPNKNYKNAVAVVEVEVEKKADVTGGSFSCTDIKGANSLECRNTAAEIAFKCDKLSEPDATNFGCSSQTQTFNCAKAGDDGNFTCQTGVPGGEAPMITALLPQEKTYNVAAITDKSVSIGGGIVTQVLGVSGSWLTGRKTYYLVQDQDTVAFSFKPKADREKKVGFLWQFRPVLGRQYVQTERKYVFVQLAFPAPPGAREGQIGTVNIRTYWREYDYKKGVVGGIIPNSLQERVIRENWEIVRYDQNPDFSINAASMENLGGGKFLVSIRGKFLQGTYVRIGENFPLIKMDSSYFRFIATANELATKKVFVVAPNGKETPLVIPRMKDINTPSAPPKVKADVKVETFDESSSKVSFELEDASYLNDRPSLVVVAGGRVFQPENEKGTGKLSVVVPTSALVENPRITLTSYFAPDGWSTNVPVPGFDASSKNERMVVMEQGENEIKFLLYGSRLGNIKPVDQALATIAPLVESEKETLQVVTMSKGNIQKNKYLFLRRDNERPFAITIPAVELKDKTPEPKMLERVLTNADEAFVEAVSFNDLDKITFHGKEISFEKNDDIRGIRLKGLRAGNVTTGTASIQPLVFLFKSGAKVTVKLEVVSSKVENIPK